MKNNYLLDSAPIETRISWNDVFPAAHRLALELECLLLDTKDTAAVSKWWDSAHEALEQWREFCREDGKVGAGETAPEGHNTSFSGGPPGPSAASDS